MTTAVLFVPCRFHLRSDVMLGQRVRGRCDSWGAIQGPSSIKTLGKGIVWHGATGWCDDKEGLPRKENSNWGNDCGNWGENKSAAEMLGDCR
jgi:hypothetical protein